MKSRLVLENCDYFPANFKEICLITGNWLYNGLLEQDSATYLWGVNISKTGTELYRKCLESNSFVSGYQPNICDATFAALPLLWIILNSSQPCLGGVYVFCLVSSPVMKLLVMVSSVITQYVCSSATTGVCNHFQWFPAVLINFLSDFDEPNGLYWCNQNQPVLDPPVGLGSFKLHMENVLAGQNQTLNGSTVRSNDLYNDAN